MTKSECVFCTLIEENASPDLREHRKGQVYSFTPLNPVTDGHRLFVPYKHFPRPDVDTLYAGMVFEEAAKWAGENDDDYNLIVNGGVDAGQTVHHLHAHYVPRRTGDGFQLPWGGVKR